MIEKPKCVRCCKEFEVFEYFNDAEDYEEELFAEGIAPKSGDALCDECAMEVIAV